MLSKLATSLAGVSRSGKQVGEALARGFATQGSYTIVDHQYDAIVVGECRKACAGPVQSQASVITDCVSACRRPVLGRAPPFVPGLVSMTRLCTISAQVLVVLVSVPRSACRSWASRLRKCGDG